MGDNMYELRLPTEGEMVKLAKLIPVTLTGFPSSDLPTTFLDLSTEYIKGDQMLDVMEHAQPLEFSCADIAEIEEMEAFIEHLQNGDQKRGKAAEISLPDANSNLYLVPQTPRRLDNQLLFKLYFLRAASRTEPSRDKTDTSRVETPSEVKPVGYPVYVNGITDGHEKEVENLLDEYGELISFEIPKSVREKFAKGEFRMLYAIGTFRNKHHAEEAIAGLTGKDVGPRKLRLKWDRPPPHAQGKGGAAGMTASGGSDSGYRGARSDYGRDDYVARGPSAGKGYGKGEGAYGGKGDRDYVGGRGRGGDRYADDYYGDMGRGGGYDYGGKGDYYGGGGKGDYYGGGRGRGDDRYADDYYGEMGRGGGYDYGGKGDYYGGGGKGDYYGGGGKGDYGGKGERGMYGIRGGYEEYPPPLRGDRRPSREASPPPLSKRQRPWETASSGGGERPDRPRGEPEAEARGRPTARKYEELPTERRRNSAAGGGDDKGGDRLPGKYDSRVDEHSIFVRNLDFDLREGDIKEHFEKQVGRVTSIELVRDHEGRSRGFGFIEFGNLSDKDRALKELDGTSLNSRTMVVQKVEPKARKAFHERQERQEAFESSGRPSRYEERDRGGSRGRDVYYGGGKGEGKGERGYDVGHYGGASDYGGKGGKGARGYDDEYSRGKGGGYDDRGYGGKGGKGYERGRGFY